MFLSSGLHATYSRHLSCEEMFATCTILIQKVSGQGHTSRSKFCRVRSVAPYLFRTIFGTNTTHEVTMSRYKCKQDSVGVRRILVVPRDSGGASTGFCWCILSDKSSRY